MYSDAMMALHLLTTMDTWGSQLRCWSRTTPNTLTVEDGVMVDLEILMLKSVAFASEDFVPNRVKSVLSGFILRLLA